MPNFFGSSYSIVKGFTDQLMSLYKDSVLNLRIRMPITGEKNGRNFITKIVNYEKVCSVPNSMSVLPELLPFVIDMMEKGKTGTINLTNPGLISHNEILKLGVSCVLTAYGSIGHEYPLFQVLVINAGNNTHIGYSFCYHTKSIKEYLLLLKVLNVYNLIY